MTSPLLLHAFSTFRVGGPQVRFAAIANHFGDRYRHALVAMDRAYDCRTRVSANVVLTQLNVPICKGDTFRNVRTFRRTLRAERPNLLLSYNWGAVEWALANRPRIVPHIHIEDGFGPEEADKQLFRRTLTRRLALARSVVVLPSRTLYRVALDRWRLAPERLHYIPNGIDCGRFQIGSRPIPLPPGSGPIVATVAALRPEKNIGRLLRAFRSVLQTAPCRLVIAGEGSQRVELEQMAREMLPADSFAFTGHIDEVERVYSSSDIFALSSDTEQMPTSLMEAMAAGLPVVSTEVGDVSEMLSAENRRYVMPRDDQAFSEALRQLVVDPAARKVIGSANRTVANASFGVSRMFSDYDALIAAEMRAVNSAPPNSVRR